LRSQNKYFLGISLGMLLLPFTINDTL
jgi:hypothetical protein